jgi:hypothetical protein
MTDDEDATPASGDQQSRVPITKEDIKEAYRDRFHEDLPDDAAMRPGEDEPDTTSDSIESNEATVEPPSAPPAKEDTSEDEETPASLSVTEMYVKLAVAISFGFMTVMGLQ